MRETHAASMMPAMRRSLPIVLALACVALAQDKRPSLPMAVFGRAEEGDWVSLVYRQKIGGKDSGLRRVVSSTVQTVEGDSVTIVARAKGGADVATVYSRTEAPSLDQFFNLGGTPVSNVRVEDAKVSIAGREFATKKLSFDAEQADGSAVKFTCWLSSE